MAARGRARIGCSGWVYRQWRGPFYPADAPQRRWFAHYAEVFDTVELNATFYRLPTEAAVDGWAAQAPPGFVYAAKVGSFGSHRMKLRDAASWLPRHLERIRRLGPALGPQLLQLPPRWRRDTGRLAEFLAAAPPDLRWAVELREPSWLHESVYEVLRDHGAALCLHDLLAEHPWELTAGFTYLRFHGPDALNAAYQGRYGPERLEDVARRVEPWLADGVDVYGYFNNDIGAAAPADAAWLAARLAGGRRSDEGPAAG